MRNDSRRLWWPVRFKAHRERKALHFFDWHGVEVGAEPVDAPWPWRRLVAQTFHFAWGHLQIQAGFTERRLQGERDA